MAVIGQQLTAPETGWKRYDDEDTTLLYEGVWTVSSYSSYYNGSTKVTKNGLLKFNFTGEKLRIITLQHKSNISNNVSIFIDGVEEKISLLNTSMSTTQVSQIIVYEKLNLEDREHSVVIINNNTEKDMAFDAVDIDANKELLTFKEIKIHKKLTLKNPTTNQYYSLAEKTLIPLPDDSPKNMIVHGIEAGKEIRLDEPFNIIRTITENSNGTQTVTDETVEPFSVYDYISENPIFLIYSESTDDIIVDTVTEPFDLYDELGEQVELIYYTDDESITEPKAKIIANYTPLDELDGNFDIVTWTDEEDDTAIRELEFEALPTSKFIISDELKRVSELVGADNSGTFKNTRFLFSENKEIWLRWNGTEFVNVTVPNINKNETIFKLGNTIEEISSIDTDTLSEKWENKSLYIGMLIQDKTHGNSVTDINLSSTQLLPTYTSTLSDLRFYILNTTAKIELNLEGNTLKGMLSDDDLTRVQYKVELNGKPYFPADGSYTELHDPPSNINLLIDTDKIRFNEENTLKIEFLDFFGTTDYYEYTFIGDYAGLMFKDIHGKHYSSDIGEILQYLDFKTVLSGETTPPHEVILKNQYGYDIKNVFMYADKAEFPTGLQLQFSKALSPFTPVPTLDYSLMENGREENFFVRLTSDRYTKPNGMSEFDIIVLAEKVE